MADDLFSPPGSQPASPDAPSPVSAPSTSAAPAASPAPASAPAARPAFVPRAVGKRKPAASRPGVAALLAAGGSASSPSVSPAATAPGASPRAAPAPPVPTAKPTEPPKQAEKLSAEERDRLEAVLSAVEDGLSDWGLSTYSRGKGRLLESLRRANGSVHVSQVVNLPNVRALTGIFADVQRALRLRPSPIVQLDESGYQVQRKDTPDYDRLETMDLAEWDETVVYFENIPFQSASDIALPLFFSSLLSTTPQRVILPPLYDPENPPPLTDEDDEDNPSAAPSQAELFARSRAQSEGKEAQHAEGRAKKPRQLPKGGGPFKGFAFVVLPSKEEADKALGQWTWDQQDAAAEDQPQGEEEADDEDEKMEEVEVEGEKKSGKGKAKKPKLSLHERVRRSGLRALSYSRWIDLKKEYLAYRRSIETLIEAERSGELNRLRHPTTRDRPPHMAKQQPPSSASVAPGSKRNKRGASPTSPLFNNDAYLPPDSTTAPPSSSKRSKRASSPSAIDQIDRRIKRLKTPPPAVDLSSPSALSIQGAFPEACVLWVRNVHEKSTKTSLKQLFSALLEQLQEGSGKGVEYVDYEKGTEVCYLRFASSPLCLLALSHITAVPSLHLTQTTLSPLSALSPSTLSTAETDARRPLVAELLQGEHERRYWAAVPEQTRRKARESAQGRVGLVKEPKGGLPPPGGWDEDEDVKPFAAAPAKRTWDDEAAEEEKPKQPEGKKRKKPSRL
ncbi:hypothetical protein JCM10207_002008 [Rhodosporidiobolus poonsookiae]